MCSAAGSYAAAARRDLVGFEYDTEVDQVVTSANEQSSEAGFEGIRSVVMSGNREKIPHILQVADPATGEVYK